MAHASIRAIHVRYASQAYGLCLEIQTLHYPYAWHVHVTFIVTVWGHIAPRETSLTVCSEAGVLVHMFSRNTTVAPPLRDILMPNVTVTPRV